jgi:hypothetical protein
MLSLGILITISKKGARVTLAPAREFFMGIVPKVYLLSVCITK